MAGEKQLQKRIETLAAEVKSWEDRAAVAVRAGDDALAKEALSRKGEKEAERDETKKAVQEAGVYADQLTAALKALEVRLKDVKLRQGSLKAKARANRDGTMTAKTSAFNDFERMSSRIDATEAEASLDEELGSRKTATIAVDRRLEQMANDATVDDALAELKRKLGK